MDKWEESGEVLVIRSTAKVILSRSLAEIRIEHNAHLGNEL